jgi:glutamyl-tRNA synthetase
MVRVRYAPSPTGALHIGGARTALFNFLYARRFGGAFVLRIEDTDRAREVEGSADALMEGLRSLGLQWDEGPDIGGPYGPYRQSERSVLYREAAERLVAQGAAYRCYCTPEELDRVRRQQQQAGLPPRYPGTCRHLTADDWVAREGQPYVLRFRLPTDGETVVHDLIRGAVHFDHAVLDDFVIQKSDGTPTYNFAVVVDDAAMHITHVIRGEEHLSNTPKQILLATALGYALPTFAHVPMILAPDRSKLSKRHGATSVAEYRALGILPEALVNYLALLGWSPPEEREIFSLQEAAAWFDLDRVQRTAAVYDQKKLEWMNGQYLRLLPVSRVAEAVKPFLAERGIDPDQPGPYPAVTLAEAVQLVRERARTLQEMADQLAFLYRPVTSYDADGIAKYFSPKTADWLSQLADALLDTPSFAPEALSTLYQNLAEAWGVKRALLIHPTRLAVTGRTVGPGLFEILAALGRDETVARLKQAAERIRSDALTVRPSR